MQFLYLFCFFTISNKSTTFIILCVLFISYILFYIANIDGFFETEKKVYYHLSLDKINEKFKYYIYYLCLNLYIFFDILFIYSTFNSDKIKKEKSIKKIDAEEPNKQNEDLNEQLIKNNNKDKNEEMKELLVII